MHVGTKQVNFKVASFPVGSIQHTEGVTAGDLGGGVGGWRGLEALCVPQASRSDKISVEGAQLEAFLSWTLSLPHSHSCKPSIALFPSVLSVPPFYLPKCISCFNSSLQSSAPSITLFFNNIFSCLDDPLDRFSPTVWCLPSGSWLYCFFFIFPFLLLPPLSRTSVKWGQPLACNAMSFLCFSLALWPHTLILASLNWPITFHVFPWAMT